jgi:hypothetical protein
MRCPKHPLVIILIYLKVFWFLPVNPIWLFQQFFASELHCMSENTFNITWLNNHVPWLFLMYLATVVNSHWELSWLCIAMLNGVDKTIGMPLWVKFGRTSGWANRRVSVRVLEVSAEVMVEVTSEMDVMMLSPILISHAPLMRLHQSRIFTAGVPGIILLRWTCPSDS